MLSKDSLKELLYKSGKYNGCIFNEIVRDSSWSCKDCMYKQLEGLGKCLSNRGMMVV